YVVALDPAGNLFINDYDNQRIRKVSVATGIITTVAGNGNADFSGDGGPAGAASLNNPYGLAVDAADNLYIGDSYNYGVRKVTPASGNITTVAGNGSAGFFGDGRPATAASLDQPDGVAVGGEGDLYIADGYNYRVRKITAGTRIITTVAGNGQYGFSGD